MRYLPVGYEAIAKNENRVLLAFERIGQGLTTCTALIFSDSNLLPFTHRSLWLAAACVCMLFYEAFWMRYFRSGRTLADFYSSLLGVPVAGATLPVIAFLLLAVYSRNVWLFISTCLLGVGHIGIHLAHRRELSEP